MNDGQIALRDPALSFYERVFWRLKCDSWSLTVRFNHPFKKGRQKSIYGMWNSNLTAPRGGFKLEVRDIPFQQTTSDIELFPSESRASIFWAVWLPSSRITWPVSGVSGLTTHKRETKDTLSSPLPNYRIHPSYLAPKKKLFTDAILHFRYHGFRRLCRLNQRRCSSRRGMGMQAFASILRSQFRVLWWPLRRRGMYISLFSFFHNCWFRWPLVVPLNHLCAMSHQWTASMSIGLWSYLRRTTTNLIKLVCSVLWATEMFEGNEVRDSGM